MSGETTAVLLFTDLVGSTEQASRAGALAADELRSVHFGLLRGAIDVSGGTEVKNLGDGLMVVFASATRAVDCAVAMQKAIHRHNQRAEERLAIRIGASAGDCIEEDGDYFGEPVIEAARLCAKADGGQIIVSDLLHMMASRRSEHQFRSLGELELKGLQKPMPSYEVAWEPDGEELAAAVAPLPGALATAASETLFGFVGRESELEQLLSAYKDASAGTLRVVLVGGEAGIGKTSIVSRLARDVHGRNGAVLFGHCDEDLMVAYQPWIEALDGWAARAPAEVIDEHLASNGPILARILSALATRAGPRRDGEEPETERYLLLRACADLLARASATAPALVVLDDLHWADASTCQLLRHLLSSQASLPILIVGTFRDTDVGPSDPFSALLADTRPHERVSRIRLVGLNDTEITELVASAAGQELDEEAVELAHALRRETAGNPYFAGELLRHLAESGDITLDADGRWRSHAALDDLELPGSVREVIGRRLHRLGDETTAILSYAAVIGRQFDLDLLAVVAGSDDGQLLDLLERTIRAGVIVETERIGRFAFAHALVQHVLIGELSATRRQRIHHQIAESLEELCGDDPGERIEELAYHWATATRAVDQAKATGYAIRAGQDAMDTLAPEEALRWFGQALEMNADQRTPDDTQRCDILLALGNVLWIAGRPTEARARFIEAAGVARRIGDPQRLSRAALGHSGDVHRFSPRDTGVVDADIVNLLREAIEAIGDTHPELSVRLYGSLAMQLVYDDGTREEQERLSGRAVALARELDDPATLATALGMRHAVMRRPANIWERLELVREMVALADRGGQEYLALHARRQLLIDLMETGDFAGADAQIEVLEASLERSRRSFFEWTVLTYRACRAMSRGRFDEAEHLLTRAAVVGEETIESAGSEFGVQLAVLRRLQGRCREIVEAVAEIVAQSPDYGTWRCGLVYALAELDEPERLRTEFEILARDDFAQLADDSAYLVGLAMASGACARLGDAAGAAFLFDALLPYDARAITATTFIYLGPASHFLGMLAATKGDFDDARRRLDAALDASRALGAEPHVCETELEIARVRLAQGDERADVAAALDELARKADALGMAHVAAEARALALS